MRTSLVYKGLRALILESITPGMSVLAVRGYWIWSQGTQESRRGIQSDSALGRQWSWTDWTVHLGGWTTSTTFRRQAPHSFVLFPCYSTLVDIGNPHSFKYFLWIDNIESFVWRISLQQPRVARFNTFSLRLRLRYQLVQSSRCTFTQANQHDSGITTPTSPHLYASNTRFTQYMIDFFPIFANDSPQIAHRHLILLISAGCTYLGCGFEEKRGFGWMGKWQRDFQESRILWNLAWWLGPTYGCMEIWKGLWAYWSSWRAVLWVAHLYLSR